MRIRGLVAVGSALLLVVGLAIAAVTLSWQAGPSVPVQQTGTAAGCAPGDRRRRSRPGRRRRFVPDASAASSRLRARRRAGRRPGPGPRRGPGRGQAEAPAPSRRPGRPDDGDRAKSARGQAGAGFNKQTSQLTAPADADQQVYANADGTKTAFQYTIRSTTGGRTGLGADQHEPGAAGRPAPGGARPPDALFDTPPRTRRRLRLPAALGLVPPSPPRPPRPPRRPPRRRRRHPRPPPRRRPPAAGPSSRRPSQSRSPPAPTRRRWSQSRWMAAIRSRSGSRGPTRPRALRRAAPSATRACGRTRRSASPPEPG